MSHVFGIHFSSLVAIDAHLVSIFNHLLDVNLTMFMIALKLEKTDLSNFTTLWQAF